MKSTNLRMGDAQKRKVSAGKAGGRRAIGDSKEVDNIATACPNKVKTTLPANRPVEGDSPFVGLLNASAEKATDDLNESIQNVQSFMQHHLNELEGNPLDMNPKDSKAYEDVQDGDALESSDNECPRTTKDNKSNVPRKVLSLQKTADEANCNLRKTFSLLTNFLPSFANRNALLESQLTNSPVTDVNVNEGASLDNNHSTEVLSNIIRPRKAFSLEDNLGEQLEYLRKTSSLVSNFHPREEYSQMDSANCQSTSSLDLNTPLTLSAKSSETDISLKTESQANGSELSRMFLDNQSGMSMMDGKGVQEVKHRRGFVYEGDRESTHDVRSEVPALNVSFPDDGGLPSSADNDAKKLGVSLLKSSITETDCRTEHSTQLERSCSQKELQQQQQQQQSQQQGGGCSQSLQSTCDVSSWSLCHYQSLPQWMQDNEFILSCHRPPLPSFFACFKSIFRLHTETLNIWTHLLGCVAFVAMGAYFLALPEETVWLQEKLAFGAFFGGGAACFALSSAYHTLWCHSPAIGRLFSKLDYCGIALLIMGSFVPWLYYAFYCRGRLLAAYLALVVALGALSVLVSLWGRFGEPRFRPLRAGVFVAYGLSGVVPALHFAVAEGWRRAIAQASLHWLALMGVLYVSGACIYALRVPERFFPGRCDLLFQSHQIFHVFVIIAALVHYHGLTEMAVYRLSFTDCASRALA